MQARCVSYAEIMAILLSWCLTLQAAANYYPQTYNKEGKCVTANRGSAALKPAYSSIL